METLLSMLLQAQKVNQILHWTTKSFAKHIALGELYEALSEAADELAEIHMGKYGNSTEISSSSDWDFSESDPVAFVRQLIAYMAQLKSQITDDFIVNKFEELEASVTRAKYKLENLA